MAACHFVLFLWRLFRSGHRLVRCCVHYLSFHRHWLQYVLVQPISTPVPLQRSADVAGPDLRLSLVPPIFAECAFPLRGIYEYLFSQRPSGTREPGDVLLDRAILRTYTLAIPWREAICNVVSCLSFFSSSELPILIRWYPVWPSRVCHLPRSTSLATRLYTSSLLVCLPSRISPYSGTFPSGV